MEFVRSNVWSYATITFATFIAFAVHGFCGENAIKNGEAQQTVHVLVVGNAAYEKTPLRAPLLEVDAVSRTLENAGAGTVVRAQHLCLLELNARSITWRHGRACPGHPRLALLSRKTWMPGTIGERSDAVLRTAMAGHDGRENADA